MGVTGGQRESETRTVRPRIEATRECDLENAFSLFHFCLLATQHRHSRADMVSFYEVLQAVSRSKIIPDATTRSGADEFDNSITATRSPRASTVSSHRGSIWSLGEGVNIDGDEALRLQEISRLLKQRFAEGQGRRGGSSMEDRLSHASSASISRVCAIPFRCGPLNLRLTDF